MHRRAEQSKAKRSIYLTLFRRCRNVPFLFEEEGQEGEVRYPHLVIAERSEASMSGISVHDAMPEKSAPARKSEV
jgi:hypothetical protein